MALPEVIKELLESGVHFGHLSKHWNPRMEKFIFGKKKNVYIIDLEKTAQKLQEAIEFIKGIVKKGEKVLFVATKRQLRDVVREQAIFCGMPYIVERWVGGLLTNFSTIKNRIKKYAELIDKKNKGELDKIPRKELVRLERQMEKMKKNYQGVISLEDLPGCIYLVDPKREIACVREANKLSIPIVGLIDTDANPEVIDYPIPGNDDAIKSVKYITSCIAKAIKEEEENIEVDNKPKNEDNESKESSQEEKKFEEYEEIEEKIIEE